MPLRYDINESLQRYVMRPLNVTPMCLPFGMGLPAATSNPRFASLGYRCRRVCRRMLRSAAPTALFRRGRQ